MGRYYDSFDDQHSSYWMKDLFKRSVNRDGIVKTDKSKSDDSTDVTLERAIELIALKRSVGNFVAIVTGQHIPVQFSSGELSYTDGKTVVLSAGADTNFDSIVGTALHEASHIKLTDFEFLQSFLADSSKVIPASLQTLFDKKFGDTKRQRDLETFVKTLFNIVEDRRIDYFIYRTAPGYRPYYEAMYDRYWHSKQIDYALRDQRVTTATVDNYLFHLTNMTNRYFDTRALPDLDIIYGLVDLNKLNRYDNDSKYKAAKKLLEKYLDVPADQTPGLWSLVFNIATIILTQSDEWALKVDDADGDGYGQPEAKSDGDSLLDNLDLSDQSSSEAEAGESEDDSTDGKSGDEDGDSDGDSEGESDADSDDDASGDDEGESDQAKKHSASGRTASGMVEETSVAPTASKGTGSDVTGDDESPYEFDIKRANRTAVEDESKRGKSGKLNESKLLKDIEKQNKFIDGKIKKGKITKKTQSMVNAMEASGATVDEVSIGDYKAKVLVIPTLTRDMLLTGASPFNYGTNWNWSNNTTGGNSKYNYTTGQWTSAKLPTSKIRLVEPSTANMRIQSNSQAGVTAGIRMGKMLASKLAIRNQNNVRKYNRQDRGKLDKRRVANIGAGDTSIFYHLRKTQYEPVYLHLTIDASSSMSGSKWQNSIALAAAVGVAAHEIENLDIEVSIRGGIGAYAVIQTIYDSTVDTPVKIRSLWPYLTCPGTTPEGLTFEAIMDRIVSRSRKRDAYFVNISDGMPWFGSGINGSYSGDFAIKHTRGQIRKMEQNGIKILSYYVEVMPSYQTAATWTPANLGSFRKMYGKAAEVIDTKSVPAIGRTLNKLFLS